MKILQLNTWMGKIEGKLQRFLEQNPYDVICMQEVMASPNRELQVARMCFDKSRIIKASDMPYSYFSPNFGMDYTGGTLQVGNLILSRIPIVKEYSTFIHGEYIAQTMLGESPANNLNLQIVQLDNGLTVANHHGYWQSQPLGNADSVRAFEKVAKELKAVEGPLVVCGDFNIIHESPAMRPLDFLRDLTDEFKIKTTLSGLKIAKDIPCDHILVNEQVEVLSFGVREDLVSDHFALQAEVAIRES